jgi:hypothetical protein
MGTTLLASHQGAATASGETTQPTYTTIVTDPDDTDGPLDVRRVKHRIEVIDRHKARLGYTVATYSPYAARRLNVRHRNFVIELNRDSHPGSERNVRVSYVSGTLIGDVISNATRETIGTVAVPESQLPAELGMVTRSRARMSFRSVDGSGWTGRLGPRSRDQRYAQTLMSAVEGVETFDGPLEQLGNLDAVTQSERAQHV